MEFGLIIPVILLAFVCEMVDSSLGMGYGTTLTPLLLALGYEPLTIVPAVLMSEGVTGVLAGIFHQEFGNVDLRPGRRDFKVAAVLAALSVIGVVIAVELAIHIPAWIMKFYIGALVFVMGLFVLKNHQSEISFSWRRIGVLGFIAAFNKGLSGGGYGPVVTCGQVLSGVRGRNAVGIASMAEGITSIVGVAIYLLSGTAISWELAASLVIGAVLSVPLAALVVSRLPQGRLTLLIGGITTVLGGYTLARVFLF